MNKYNDDSRVDSIIMEARRNQSRDNIADKIEDVLLWAAGTTLLTLACAAVGLTLGVIVGKIG